MPSLGNFGTTRPPLDLDFGWFGATIRVNPRASDLALTEFMSHAEGITLPDIDGFDEDNPTAEHLQQMAAAMNAMASVTKALQKFMRDQIHPDDWDTFWRLAIENGQQNSDLLALSKALASEIAEHIAGFPTGQSSASAPTPANTKPRSAAGSSSRQRQVEDDAMRLLSGRPDLRLVLHRQRQEALSA